MRKSLETCIDIVRTCDYPAYICTLVVPDIHGARSAMFALRAFYLETGLIKARQVLLLISFTRTSDPSTARLRLEFWKTSVASAFSDSPVHHPVIQELSLARSLISRSWLSRILAGRVYYNFQFSSQETQTTFTTLSDVTSAAESTFSTLNYTLLEALGVKVFLF